MVWYQLVSAFFAGMLLANTVPHFVHGISGDPFPTPFARPPGKGLSSPLVNVLWALFNGGVGTLLFRTGKVACGGIATLAVFLAGIALLSIALSISFQKKHTP